MRSFVTRGLSSKKSLSCSMILSVSGVVLSVALPNSNLIWPGILTVSPPPLASLFGFCLGGRGFGASLGGAGAGSGGGGGGAGGGGGGGGAALVADPL